MPGCRNLKYFPEFLNPARKFGAGLSGEGSRELYKLSFEHCQWHNHFSRRS
ncbi:hypothetical protein SPHINGO391_390263 [Sphingomonas aurantiaca]|uniref:Uncharacterized protein n=1 Tax=Sphingomonas aurantiaca TaxID=185949 RepID=A0A5E7YQP2_9SPHN|nr:hypothetical protein SPHINGO391_390263 [Sphingomonas aurantiaca]